MNLPVWHYTPFFFLFKFAVQKRILYANLQAENEKYMLSSTARVIHANLQAEMEKYMLSSTAGVIYHTCQVTSCISFAIYACNSTASNRQCLEQPSWNLRTFILPFNARAKTSNSSTYHSSVTTA